MGVKKFYEAGLTDLERTVREREWAREDLNTVAADRARWRMTAESAAADAKGWRVEAERLHRAGEGFARQYEADIAHVRAVHEAEQTLLKADLVRSDLEKAELELELNETRDMNGELMLEIELLRRKIGADPVELEN